VRIFKSHKLTAIHHKTVFSKNRAEGSNAALIPRALLCEYNFELDLLIIPGHFRHSEEKRFQFLLSEAVLVYFHRLTKPFQQVLQGSQLHPSRRYDKARKLNFLQLTLSPSFIVSYNLLMPFAMFAFKLFEGLVEERYQNHSRSPSSTDILYMSIHLVEVGGVTWSCYEKCRFSQSTSKGHANNIFPEKGFSTSQGAH
jgi:hypothetical protein